MDSWGYVSCNNGNCSVSIWSAHWWNWIMDTSDEDRLKAESVRRIRHLNRLATWAQQDPTGPLCAKGVQAWVLSELRAALGADYQPTEWSPSVQLPPVILKSDEDGLRAELVQKTHELKQVRNELSGKTGELERLKEVCKLISESSVAVFDNPFSDDYLVAMGLIHKLRGML